MYAKQLINYRIPTCLSDTAPNPAIRPCILALQNTAQRLGLRPDIGRKIHAHGTPQQLISDASCSLSASSAIACSTVNQSPVSYTDPHSSIPVQSSSNPKPKCPATYERSSRTIFKWQQPSTCAWILRQYHQRK